MLSDAVALAVAPVAGSVDDFIPGLSNLVECFGLRLLTLVCISLKRNRVKNTLFHGIMQFTCMCVFNSIIHINVTYVCVCIFTLLAL